MTVLKIELNYMKKKKGSRISESYTTMPKVNMADLSILLNNFPI